MFTERPRPLSLSPNEIYIPSEEELMEYCVKHNLDIDNVKSAIAQEIELYEVIEQSAQKMRERLRAAGIETVEDFLIACNFPRIDKLLLVDGYPIQCAWMYDIDGGIFGRSNLSNTTNVLSKRLLFGRENIPPDQLPRLLFHATSSITLENLVVKKLSLIPHYLQSPDITNHLGRAAKVLIWFFTLLGSSVDTDYQAWIFTGPQVDPDEIRFIEKLVKEFGNLANIEERILKIFFKDLKTYELSDCMKEVFTQLLLQQPVSEATINQLMDDLYNFCHVRGPRAKNIRNVLAGNIKLTTQELGEIHSLIEVEALFGQCLFSYTEKLDYHENTRIFPVILVFDQRKIEKHHNVANLSISIFDIRSPEVFFAAASAPPNSLVAVFVPDAELNACVALYQHKFPYLHILPMSEAPPQIMLNNTLPQEATNDPHNPSCELRYTQTNALVCVKDLLEKAAEVAPLMSVVIQGNEKRNPLADTFYLEEYPRSYPIVLAQSLEYRLTEWFGQLSTQQKRALDALLKMIRPIFPGVFAHDKLSSQKVRYTNYSDWQPLMRRPIKLN